MNLRKFRGFIKNSYRHFCIGGRWRMDITDLRGKKDGVPGKRGLGAPLLRRGG